MNYLSKKSSSIHRGMTMAEVLVALAAFITVMVAVTAFEANIFVYKNSISASFQTAQDAQIITKTMLTELREIAPGANGAYPLISAGSTTVSFFSDANNDGSTEQITYSITNGIMYRAVVHPTGNPVVYNIANQSTTTLLRNITNSSSTAAFQYFDTNYNGTTTPLAQPVTTTAVRLIKVNLTLDLDTRRSPIPVTYTIQANLRNLKSNL